MMGLVSILGGIGVMIGGGYLYNKVALNKENAILQPKGQMVEVDGGKINVYSEGNGEDTIVILSGYGVSLPQVEYAPLMRELTDKYRVVICDYKGMGFSDETKRERTVTTMTNETREALKKAGIEGPYIFMPHSLGGVIVENYAINYPEEVKAIVLIDSTPTIINEQKMPPIKFIGNLSKGLQSIGVTRLQIKLAPLPYKAQNGYSEEDAKLIKTFIKRMWNDTMIDIAVAMPKMIEELSQRSLPEGIPVLKIISKVMLDGVSKQLKRDAMEDQEKHLKKLGNDTSYELVEYTHAMTQTHAPEIAAIAKKFLKEKLEK